MYEDNLRKFKTEIKKSKEENNQLRKWLIAEVNDNEKHLLVLSTQTDRHTIQMRQEYITIRGFLERGQHTFVD